MPPSALPDFEGTPVFIGKQASWKEKPTHVAAPTVSIPRLVQTFSPPLSRFISMCHPLEKEITAEVDSYFLTHWGFKTDKERKKFVGAGFSRVTCLYFPLSKDDRIHLACRLLTILFLVDGMFAQSTYTGYL